MQLPIGYDNFGKILEKKLDFVDKTLFIKEVIDDKATEVSVITRPRRFGKTFNLSMLHYFLARHINGKSTQGMFANLKIAAINNGKYLQNHQGQYPVIFISFKEIKEATFQNALQKLKILIKEICRSHRYLLHSDQLEKDEQKLFQQFLIGKVSQMEMESFLKTLSELLYKHYDKKVYLLIDEYDTPIQASYVKDGAKKNYYTEMINFMRNFLGAALKTNPYLEKAIITGILRIAKESLFSGLNNVCVYTLLQNEFSQYFGFTEKEVSLLLKQANLETKAENIRDWYNGYRFGNTIVYNPWSIVNCIKKKGLLQPYWLNTSDNDLIRNLLIQSSTEFKEQFELLLQKKPMAKIINEHTVFSDLDNNPTAAWSLLVMAGYLKVIATRQTERGATLCDIAIPNHEVNTLYRNIIEQWLANGRGIEWYDLFLNNLLTGEIEKFKQDLEQILLRTVSAHDLAHQPEAFYHGLMLGFTASLSQNEYEIKSNRESGLGRYDILIIPKNEQKLAIILELKNVPHTKKTTKNFDLMALLSSEAQKALEQINQNNYSAELQQRGIANIVKIGIAFCGKRFRLQSERAVN